MSKIFAFNALTNGIYGPIFAISAIVYENGKETASFFERCPIEEKPNMWLENEILPYVNNYDTTIIPQDEMFKKFATFYLKHKSNAKIVTYLGFNVEAKLFGYMHGSHLIGDWDFPYPMVDVATILEERGYNPFESKDCKLIQEKYAIKFLSCYKEDPLYKARYTALCYEYLK